MIWIVLGAGIAVIAVALWSPMRVAWSCYWRHANGARAETELVEKLGSETLMLRFTTGPRLDRACTAKTSHAHFESVQPGTPLAVVYFEDRPGDCVLVATVENSGLVLWSISGVLFFGLLLVLGVGLGLQRSLTRSAMRSRPSVPNPLGI